MSQVYATEPQTAGRVIFETTHGPIEVQLWSRECPATTKLFLQLCLDGYYDNVIFHRIVPNFLIQTGALRFNPTARRTSQQPSQEITSLDTKVKELGQYRRKVQADQALSRRPYELNTRIRFNHRGQVAMALEVENEAMGEDEMALLQPQFFITLDEAPELDGKHVCFGTVSGPTIFNALRIGNTDIDESTNQPSILHEAPRVERVKIMENPIHTDIVPLPGIMPWKIASGADMDDPKQKKKKRKAVKNINVLSFGDEMEDDFNGQGGIKSSHDVLETKKLSKKVDEKLQNVILATDNDQKQKDSQPRKSEKTESSKRSTAAVEVPVVTSGSPAAVDEIPQQTGVSNNPSLRKRNDVDYTGTNKQEKATPDPPPPQNDKSPKMSIVEARRAKYAKASSKDKRKREEDTMAKFLAFQSKVTTKRIKQDESNDNNESDDGLAARMAKRKSRDDKEQDQGDMTDQEAVTYHGQILDNDNDVTGDWMATRFKCKKHQDLDAKLGGDGRDAMEDYEVVDEKLRGSHSRSSNRHQKHKKNRDEFLKR